MNSRRNLTVFLLTSFFCLQLSACIDKKGNQLVKSHKELKIIDTMKLKITIGTSSFSASLENNATAKAFKEQLPLTLTMAELNNNEKYADLSASLPTNATNLRTVQNGDLMLYGSKTLVLFYKTFSTSYSYTKLGKIDNPEDLAKALGISNVTVTFELE